MANKLAFCVLFNIRYSQKGCFRVTFFIFKFTAAGVNNRRTRWSREGRYAINFIFTDGTFIILTCSQQNTQRTSDIKLNKSEEITFIVESTIGLTHNFIFNTRSSGEDVGWNERTDDTFIEVCAAAQILCGCRS